MRRIDYINALNARVNIEKHTIPATGVDNIALPVTAANIGMKAQLFGQSAENLMVNGDFRNGTTGWLISNGTMTTVDGKLVFTYIQKYGYLGAKLNLVAGDKYYVAIKYENDEIPTDAGQIYWGTNLAPTFIPPKKTELFTAITQPVPVGVDRFSIYLRQSEGKKTTYEYIMLINIPQTLGAGNEPTKEKCDLLFANYFEGTNNVLGTGRIRSVNSAGLLPSSLYFNGGTLRSNGLIKDEIRKGANGYELVKRVGVGTLGSELIINAADREFSSDTGFWTKGGNVTIANGVFSFASGVSFPGIGTNTSLVVFPIGHYKVKLDIISIQSGAARGQFGSSPETDIGSTIGSKTAFIRQTTGSPTFQLRERFVGSGDNISIQRIIQQDGEISNTSTFTELSDGTILYTLATPVITPITHAGLLNSNSNGMAYFEPIIADAGVYSSNLAIQLTDYPINSFEQIRKYANGAYTELNIATAVIASGGLSFTHPDLASGDLVMFTYEYDMESIGRAMTLTYFDSRYIVKDTANANVYRITPTITNGVLTWTLTLV